MEEINQLKREGLSILAISNLTGYDRKTIQEVFVGADRKTGVSTETGAGWEVVAFRSLFGRATAGRRLEREGTAA